MAGCARCWHSQYWACSHSRSSCRIAEKERAIVELRREAVDLAIKGAGKVIEQNLDSAANRKLVESFLATVKAN